MRRLRLPGCCQSRKSPPRLSEPASRIISMMPLPHSTFISMPKKSRRSKNLTSRIRFSATNTPSPSTTMKPEAELSFGFWFQNLQVESRLQQTIESRNFFQCLFQRRGGTRLDNHDKGQACFCMPGLLQNGVDVDFLFSQRTGNLG